MNTAYARHQMVDQQIRTWDIPEARLLDLLKTLPREDFVPPAFRELAYSETEIPLGHGQRMMYPMVEGKLLQALLLEPQDDVLEIGTGSGYLTACLGMLAGNVVSIDIHQDFLTSAAAKLQKLQIDNVELKRHDAAIDGPPDGLFDAIAVTGSLSSIDERLVTALKPGGRLFLVTGDEPVMDAKLITRDGSDSWRSQSLFETSLGRLQNAGEPPGFRF